MSKMIRRDKFDPTRDFVVRKPFTVFGKRVTPGQPFDKLLLSERRLRQMYDIYMIEHAAITAIPAAGLVMPVESVVESIPQSVAESIPQQTEPMHYPSPADTELPLTRSERVRAAKRISRQTSPS